MHKELTKSWRTSAVGGRTARDELVATLAIMWTRKHPHQTQTELRVERAREYNIQQWHWRTHTADVAEEVPTLWTDMRDTVRRDTHVFKAQGAWIAKRGNERIVIKSNAQWMQGYANKTGAPSKTRTMSKLPSRTPDKPFNTMPIWKGHVVHAERTAPTETEPRNWTQKPVKRNT